MTVVTVSSKYQVVIPKEIREAVGIEPGQKVMIIRFGEHIEIVPVRPMRDARGILRGIDTEVPRDEDRI